jgi:hypothetical protein
MDDEEGRSDEMRKIKMAGLVLVVVGTICALSSAGALAESESLVDGAAVPSTAKVHVETGGTEEYWDMKAKIKLLCTLSWLKTVWDKSGKVEEGVAASCTVEEGSCGSPNVLIKNLPWNAETVLVGGAFRETYKSSGAGSPGWDITCFGFVEDTCLSETFSAGLSNSEGINVIENGDEESGEANCSLGGAGGLWKYARLAKALEGLSYSKS